MEIARHLKTCKKHGFKIPKEDYIGKKSAKNPSGKIPLRIKPELHDIVMAFAQANELSVNRFIEKTIEKEVGFSSQS